MTLATHADDLLGRTAPPGLIPDLRRTLHDLLTQIAPGEVASCGALARALGDVAGARWIAQTLMEPQGPHLERRHRIVLRDGSPGKWSSADRDDWERRLAAEGVACRGGRVDLDRYEKRSLVCDSPLTQLRRLQEQLAAQIAGRTEPGAPRLAAGIDLAYCRGASPAEFAAAACAVVDVHSCELVWSTTVIGRVTFPYIPGYLSFRELPLMLEVVRRARDAGWGADVIFIDGQGRLHPRHAGLATHVGVVAGATTIGVGKRLLCGSVDAAGLAPGQRRRVVHQGEVTAYALTGRRRARPFFVSVGYGCELDWAAALAAKLCKNHRLPEPIWYAHKLATAKAKNDLSAG